MNGTSFLVDSPSVNAFKKPTGSKLEIYGYRQLTDYRAQRLQVQVQASTITVNKDIS